MKPIIFKQGDYWILIHEGCSYSCNTWEYALSTLRMNLKHPELSMSRFVNPAWWFKHKLGKSDAWIAKNRRLS